MQQIERYGVIALVFLLVTIVAVSFWGDSKSPGFWSRLTGKSDGKKEQVVEPATTALVSEHVVDPNVPLSSTNGAISTSVPLTALATGNTQSPTDTPSTGNATIQPPDGFAQPLAPGTIVPVTVASALGSPISPPAKAFDSSAARGPSGRSEYIVQQGDSLARIAAKKLGKESRWSDIQSANPGLDPKHLSVGQRIFLPEAGQVAAQKVAVTPASKPTTTKSAPKAALEAPKVAKATKPAASKSTSAHSYVVKKGDHLASIAGAELGNTGRWKDIVAANPGLDANKLEVGQSLRLPGAAFAHQPVLATEPNGTSKPRVR